jgi:hypothetical protein
MRGVVCKAEFKTRNDGNNRVKLKIGHLPRPGQLRPPRPSYVTWLHEPDGQPSIQNVLIVDKNGKAEFERTIRSVNFSVFVTAEEEVSPKSPHGPALVTAEIHKVAGN